MTKVINLAAGPGAGKSTTAAGLFCRMKLAGESVELVTEFAKDRVWGRNLGDLESQLYVLGEQDRRQRQLVGKVDYIITDSPLFLSAIYAVGPYVAPWFKEAAHEAFESYDNINIFIRRVKPYREYGRLQSETEAKLLDALIRNELEHHGRYWCVDGNERAPEEIMHVIQELKDEPR